MPQVDSRRSFKICILCLDKNFGDVQVPCIVVSFQYLAIFQSTYFPNRTLLNVLYATPFEPLISLKFDVS